MATSDDTAAGVPPQGLSTDFEQNSDLWPSIIAVSVVTLVLIATAVLVRLYARARVSPKKLRCEDYLSTFAAALVIAWTVIFDVTCHLGISRHIWNVRASVMPRALSLLNISDIVYGFMMGAGKFDLLLQLWRYSLSDEKAKRRMKWLVYATGAVIFGYYFSCIFMFAMQCLPREAIWDPTVKAKCISSPGSTFAASAFGLLTDLMLFALFLWLILLLGSRQLGGWLCLGSITFVALLGILSASITNYYRIPFMDHGADITYHIGIVGIWAMVEYAAIILAGCIPSFGVWLGRSGTVRPTGRASDEESSVRSEEKEAGAK